MVRRPYGPRTRLAPDHTPHVRNNILRSDRYEFVAGPHIGCGRFGAADASFSCFRLPSRAHREIAGGTAPLVPISALMASGER